jgi:lipopolysaccharide biosynthesis regulator YciM
VKFLGPLRTLVALAPALLRWAVRRAASAPAERDGPTADLMRQALEARAAGRPVEAAIFYRRVLERRRSHLAALRGLRDLAIEATRWDEAIEVQERLTALASPSERGPEAATLAATHYQAGRAELARGDAAAAIGRLKSAVRADRRFVPAALALGDAYEAAGDHREAVRAWERGAEAEPVLPLLARLERVYRDEGRPNRMIALYREALTRAPDDPALAMALGRVYFELEMLDEAAEQFEKVEVRAPDAPAVHAFLGAVFERREQWREAFEEYRRALQLGRAFEWPHRCEACGEDARAWHERCARCGCLNTLRPAPGR